MKTIPTAVQSLQLIQKFTNAGLTHLGSGKTGELFENPRFTDILLIYRSDRSSIFDFILSASIPYKGSVLTAMPVLWLLYGGVADVLKKYGGHHIIQFGSAIDAYLPGELHGDQNIQKCMLVIRKFETPEAESIVRGFITGNGITAYRKNGTVCGHVLPEGLQDGGRLPSPIYTPTTKADSGHDEPIDYHSARHAYGMGPENLSIDLFEAASRYAETRNLLLADAKFEISLRTLTLIDEFLTPDTMRIWEKFAWEAAQAKVPPKAPEGYDKEYLRRWGKTVKTPFVDKSGLPIVGINLLDPEDPDHVKFVSGLIVPEEVIDKTSKLYLKIPELLFGITLDEFWRVQGNVVT